MTETLNLFSRWEQSKLPTLILIDFNCFASFATGNYKVQFCNMNGKWQLWRISFGVYWFHCWWVLIKTNGNNFLLTVCDALCFSNVLNIEFHYKQTSFRFQSNLWACKVLSTLYFLSGWRVKRLGLGYWNDEYGKSFSVKQQIQISTFNGWLS